jgi:hypothetical protein
MSKSNGLKNIEPKFKRIVIKWEAMLLPGTARSGINFKNE